MVMKLLRKIIMWAVSFLWVSVWLMGFCHRANAANLHYSLRAFKLQNVAQVQQLSVPKDSIHKGKIYMAADQLPQLKGTLKEFYQKVQYPKKCRKAGVQGQVTVQFIVSRKGIPTHVHVLKGIGSGCDKAAISAVKKYARFTPGMNNGEPVRAQMALSIRFKLLDHRKGVYKSVDKKPKLKLTYSQFQEKVPLPKGCWKSDVDGRVILSFIVNKKGAPQHIRVLNGIGNGCDHAAVLAMKRYGRFTPGMLNGKTVKVRMTYSVLFNDYLTE